jgi:hypothetical protein
MAIGSEHHDHSGFLVAGAVYVYVRDGGGWTLEQKVTPSSPGNGDHFGHSVALWGDDLVVGTVSRDKAYIFHRDGGTWTEVDEISKPALGGNFGATLAIHGDTAVIGARSEEVSFQPDAGAAYVYERSAGVWSETQRLTADDAEEDDRFGWAVAVFDDAIVIGARFDDHSGKTDPGSAYVFTNSGGTWSEQQKLVAETPASGQHFGASVALHQHLIEVGAPYDSPLGVFQAGQVHLFARAGNTWYSTGVLSASDMAEEDHFGVVAIDSDTTVVGSPSADHSGYTDAGAAYIYQLPVFADSFESGDTLAWSTTVP